MNGMKHLARLVGELEDQLVTCMRCGMCQAVCPLFAETGRESDVARGKLALLDGLLQEMFAEPGGVRERLTRCLLCGSCAANCPSGVKVLDIFLKARAILTAYTGLSPMKKALFRGILAHPGFFDLFFEWGSKAQALFLTPQSELLGTSCSRFVPPLADRHINALAPVPFHRMAAARQSSVGGSGPRVAFFVGCLVDKIFPDIGKAVLHSIAHHGVEAHVPEGQGCCGIPAISAGDGKTFHRLIRHNLKRFSARPFDYLVTACATCTATIRKIWPLMAVDLTREELAQMHAVCEKTLDISQFLVDKAGLGQEVRKPADDALSVTYHDPCHLKKSLGVADQPRAIIRMNPGYRFREMVEADRCCGCGGSFNLDHYDLSKAIGQRKRDRIVESGCSVVATGCPACMLQLSDMLSQGRNPIRVKHAIEIYAESL